MTFPKAKHTSLQVGLLLIVATLILSICAPAVADDDAKQAMFERVFGDAVKLDPARVAKVKALPPGKRLLVDRDGDGKNDEVWYIDTAARHTKRPVLIRVIDEDGDLDKDGRPDLDNDLYIADWNADGTVDSVTDYQDNDGDGDVDEMGIYYWNPKDRDFLKKDTLRVWWAYDDGDDNLLWYNVNWNYIQHLCQHRCHFSGDETFVSFGLQADSDRWLSAFENPFVFYDPDGDGCSEVTVRCSGRNDTMDFLRYSIDADGDAYGRRAYDYDFAVWAWAEKSDLGSEVKLNDEITFATKLRGIPTQRVLRWDALRKFVQQSPWAKASITWDEMNANVVVPQQPYERWEGVFRGANSLNKRCEISLNPANPLRLYYDPTDHRLHLLATGAAEGQLRVDYDLDGKMDAVYTYLDENKDGILDRRLIDLDADGKPEFDWKMKGKDVREIKLEYKVISTFYKKELTKVLAESQRFIDVAKTVLGDRLTSPDPVETFFLTKLQLWYPVPRLGPRMRSTPAGARYYVDFIRDRLLYALKREFGKHQAWDGVEAVYAAGNYADAAALVLKNLAPDAKVVLPARFESFTNRIPICIDNTGGPQRDHLPVVLSVKELRAVADNFNPDNCAVVAPDRWIDWLEIPHQVDQIDVSAGKELSFLADVAADAPATYYLYYSPTGNRDKHFANKTGTWGNWLPSKVNIAWESTFAGYRTYEGHFDFFGKHKYNHNKKVEWLIGLRKNDDYHHELEWGMDALHVGNTSGLGGLTLYAGDRAWIVRNPGCKGALKFTKRMLVSGPIRAAVEIKVANIIPDKPDLSLRILCITYAEHQESEIRVAADGAGQSMLLAPGLTKLPHEKSFVDKSLGCLGAWGWQENSIGEVGLGLIVPPVKLKKVIDLAAERRLQCDFSDGMLRYWIIGDWRRGRRFPVAPTIDNWRKEMQTLAAILHRDVRVTIGSADAETTIVVDFGRYSSAQIAGHSEADVNWLDADTADDTACAECFAALELQRYLRKITGRRDDFAIVDDDTTPGGELILVGGPTSNAASRCLASALGVDAKQLTELGPEGYRIKSGTVDGRRATLIAGGSRMGTLYGAYDLLYRMGCRWFGPEQFHEDVPRARWQPEFDVTERPSFLTRGFYVYEERGDTDFFLWMARNRLNDWHINRSHEPLMRKLGIHSGCGMHDAEWLFLSPVAAYPYNHPRFQYDEQKPKDPYPVSEQYQGDADKDGKLSYFEAHPEWYPLEKDHRIPGVGKSVGTNFCTSNADACTEFVKNYVQALIDGRYQGAEVVNFWTLDGGKWCQCPKCKALGTPTDRNLLLVYRFNQQIKKARAEGKIHHPIAIRFLVYHDVLQPPTRPLPADFDYGSCCATFYPISRCYVHKFDNPDCTRNARYQRLLHSWAVDPKRHYRGGFIIGEYYNVSRYKSLPICFMHSMAHDIPYYHKVGAQQFQYMHVTTGRWGSKSLTNYQMARQLWDVDTDCEVLWKDYFARRYGPAADTMRSFYESLEKMLSNVEPIKGWSGTLAYALNAGAKNLFPKPDFRYKREPGVTCNAPTLLEMVEHGKICRKLIDRATTAELPERIKTRIAEDERTFTYAERTLAYYSECVQAFQLGRAGKLDEARRHFAQAKQLAELLRQDTWSVGLAYIHNEPFELNAFNATYATGALWHLEKLLGPVE